ncbi:MAG: insulinase family protein [Chitinivibrionia bacterium]|nr:insulinase family protein [Chitinivibrionia bacterium]
MYFKKLVEEKGIAKSSAGGGPRMFGGGSDLAVDASQDSKKYAGAFKLSAEGISGVRSEQMEAAIYEVIDDLRNNAVTDTELQKVKNQLRVQKIRFMDMMSGIGILFYLGQNAALGDWTEANNNPKMCDLVTADDVKRVANTYLANDRRSVLIINSKADAQGEGGGAGAEDPRYTQAVQMIKSMTDPAQLEQMMGMFSTRMDQVKDPEQKARMEKLLKLAGERLKELKAAEKK